MTDRLQSRVGRNSVDSLARKSLRSSVPGTQSDASRRTIRRISCHWCSWNPDWAECMSSLFFGQVNVLLLLLQRLFKTK